MAKFAELDSNNIVLRVLAVDNFMIVDEGGNEQESKGIEFLQSLFGKETRWKQTFFTGGSRKNYAGIGYTYDKSRDAFINERPIVDAHLDKYVLFNEEKCLWEFNPPQPEIGVTRI